MRLRVLMFATWFALSFSGCSNDGSIFANLLRVKENLEGDPIRCEELPGENGSGSSGSKASSGSSGKSASSGSSGSSGRSGSSGKSASSGSRGGSHSGSGGRGHGGRTHRGGGGQALYLWCHVPPGNPAAEHTLALPQTAISNGHANHSEDYAGKCISTTEEEAKKVCEEGSSEGGSGGGGTGGGCMGIECGGEL